MTIIKITTKKVRDEDETKHVGAYVPKSLASFLTLYNYANGCSKSSVLTKLLREWVLSLREDDVTEDVLIEDMVQKTIVVWKKKKAKNHDASLKDFKNQFISELEWKGLTLEIIKKILTGFNDGTK